MVPDLFLNPQIQYKFKLFNKKALNMNIMQWEVRWLLSLLESCKAVGTQGHYTCVVRKSRCIHKGQSVVCFTQKCVRTLVTFETLKEFSFAFHTLRKTSLHTVAF